MNLNHPRLYPCPNIKLGKTGYTWVYDFPSRYEKIASDLDILHTHHPFTMGTYARKIAQKFHKPLLFTNHTQYDQYVKYVPLLKGVAYKLLCGHLRRFCNKCSLVVAPSYGIKEIIENIYKTKTPVEVVPNGIEIEKFQHRHQVRPAEIKDIPKDAKLILFVGRVCYEKNIDFVIRAFEKVLDQYKNVYFLIVGGGPACEEFRDLAQQLNIEHNVIMTGAVNYKEIMKYYRHADFFVSASKTEVHPLVGLEAVASGLPIVALSSVGYDDIVKNGFNGYLTRDDENEFVKKIVHLLKSPDLVKEMSGNALDESKKYSVCAAAENMVRAYEKALKLV
jgi:glycosyltransferase involved in cell wall biosynthesis